MRMRNPPRPRGGEAGGAERTGKWKEWGGEGLTLHPRGGASSVQPPTQFKAAGPEAGEKAAAQVQQRFVTSFGNPGEISEPSRAVVFRFGHPLFVGLLLRAEESKLLKVEPWRFELRSQGHLL